MIELRTPEDRDLAAGEYVLGTLDDADRATFERALADDRALQAAVHAWQDRLLPLSARASARTPASDLWSRIEATLGDAAPAARDAASAGSARATRPTRAPTPRWWQRLVVWQGLSAAAVAASLVLAVALVTQTTREVPGPRYLAVLQAPQGGATGWIVEVRSGGELRLLPAGDAAAAAVPEGRALQFWTKPEGASGPTSLGLVEPGRPMVMPVSRLPAVGQRQLFEITLEPAGGSPYDRPSGPILYVGKTLQL